MKLETDIKILEQKSITELKKLAEQINIQLEAFTNDGNNNSKAIKEYEKTLLFISKKIQGNK